MDIMFTLTAQVKSPKTKRKKKHLAFPPKCTEVVEGRNSATLRVVKSKRHVCFCTSHVLEHGGYILH